MEDSIKVGIGEYKVSRSPHSLITIALGSCVGIALYDSTNRIGGLSHIMLPDSTAFQGEQKVGKFADLAIPSLVEELQAMGASKHLKAKIAGGASMFKISNPVPQMQIGQRNIAAVKEVLASLDIPIIGEHTGDHVGRTMWLDLTNLAVGVRTATREYIDL
ncbi:chemotaxis protein CheD [Jeotgalibaca caeni]|uniref:chemotaxis protein CheD n=1 Tax=Jeotgalibaca caeni TaxID=3028623 RepID=UPI00237DA526|nr:chemotaxis protein CheD [Jeotgalibaca caeni]MDE1548306.1 chemotaxis protein CheD [Jeotgalibaca caeni]